MNETSLKNLKIHIKRIENTSEIPYDLLALADPSRSMINKYLKTGLCYLAKSGRKVVGVLVLNKIDKTRIEVKNIAIAEGEQGKGFGKALLEFCESVSRELGFDTLVIGTGNSSLDQLALYQKVGFEMFKIQKDFFIKNYSEPIFENGIQCKHMVILEKELRRSYHNKSHSL